MPIIDKQITTKTKIKGMIITHAIIINSSYLNLKNDDRIKEIIINNNIKDIVLHENNIITTEHNTIIFPYSVNKMIEK